MTASDALSLNGVSYSHDKGKALHECSVDIPKGKTTVILGPNGAGKSIFLKLCHGLIEPSEGKISSDPEASESAMVFPKPVLLRRSVLENMLYVLEMKNTDKDGLTSIAMSALEKFSMDKYADYPARLLSSGEQQRISLIRALLLKPQILYLDEPTSNLDPTATATLESMISDSRKNDVTIVMATHDLMQARRIGEYIIYIENGVVLESSAAEDFFTQPKNERAKRFIAGKL